ncbi:MAG: transposase [Magnetococcales bacterium]|nr:transposase [Magnetococcales bacterium]
MARIARVVAPGKPHYIIQRGNRDQKTFFSDEDYQAYRDLLAEWCRSSGVAVWAYCLLPEQVHLVAAPEDGESLRRGVGEAHRRYTRLINARKGWRGHLWQERFASCPLDEGYALEAVRFVETLPVRQGLVKKARKYPWSSVAAHLGEGKDPLVHPSPVVERVEKWGAFLKEPLPPAVVEKLLLHSRTGRPLGEPTFLKALEAELDRPLLPRKPGPRGKKPEPDAEA